MSFKNVTNCKRSLTSEIRIRMIPEVQNIVPAPACQVLKDFHRSLIVNHALLQFRNSIPCVRVSFLVKNSESIDKKSNVDCCYLPHILASSLRDQQVLEWEKQVSEDIEQTIITDLR